MKITKRPKNSRLIEETNRFFEYVESNLIPANKQYLRAYETSLEKLEEEFNQAKASSLQEIEDAIAKGSSNEEAYECSNLSNIKEQYDYQRFELEAFQEQVLVHSTMHSIVLIQSHVESMLLLLCKENLEQVQFESVSKKRIEVLKEYLKALGLQHILSSHYFCIVKKFAGYRNEYIHDQYLATIERDTQEEEIYMLESPSMKLRFTQNEFENYLRSAKQLIEKAFNSI